MKMRKHVGRIIVFSLLLVVLMAGSSVAAEKWELGVRAGATGARLRGDQVGMWLEFEDLSVAGALSDYKWGFSGGLMIKRNITEHFAIELDALYNQKGGKGTVVGEMLVEYPGNVYRPGEINGELTASLDYVEFPVLAVFSFPAEYNIFLEAIVGATFGFNIFAETRFQGRAEVTLEDDSKDIVDIDQKRDISRIMKSSEVGLLIGIGVRIPTSYAEWVFDARWSGGLTTIDNTTRELDVRNSYFQFGVGVMMPLSRK
jgi:hypothetical protein